MSFTFSRRQRRRVALEVESLEDRLVPTTTIYVGPTAADLITQIVNADHIQGPVVLNLQPKATYVLGAPDSSISVISVNGLPILAPEQFDWYGPNGLPAIDNDITINGNGAVIERASSVNGSPAPDFRLFYVSGGYSGLPLGKLTLNDVTLENGLAKGGRGGPSGGGGLGAGGAIFNQGTLSLNRVTFADNFAIGGDGGDDTGAEGGGGGIGSSADNAGDGGGFGNFPIGMYGGLGAYGAFEQGGGGGGFRPGDNGNSPNAGDGGGLGGLGSGTGDGGDGGAGAAFDDYNLNAYGGAFGFGGTFHTGDGGGGGGIGGGGAGGDADPNACSTCGAGLYGGGGGFGGGGGAHAGNGGFGGGAGGIFASASIPGFGGGDANGGGGGGGGAGLGGAVFNMGDVGILQGCGILSMTDCTLNANTAQGGYGGSGGNDGTAGAGGSGFGGGIFNLDGLASLADCTVDGNTVVAGRSGWSGPAADGSAAGGAVYNLAFGNLISTGGPTGSELGLFNSILADSKGGADLVSLAVHGKGANYAEVIGSTNLVQSYIPIINSPISPGVITIHGVSPNLGPLQNNGGLTPTMALGLFSPAFGKGNPNAGGVPQNDQRSLPRLDAGQLDLGAYEFQHRDLIFKQLNFLGGMASHAGPPSGQNPGLVSGALDTGGALELQPISNLSRAQAHNPVSTFGALAAGQQPEIADELLPNGLPSNVAPDGGTPRPLAHELIDAAFTAPGIAGDLSRTAIIGVLVG
jgi:hypothetical protein